MPLEISTICTHVHGHHAILVDGVPSSAYRLFLPSSSGTSLAPLLGLAHIKADGHTKLDHRAVVHISGVVTCRSDGQIVINANRGGIKRCIGRPTTPHHPPLFTIVGTVRSRWALGERYLLVEVERTFTTCRHVGIAMKAYSEEAFDEFNIGCTIQAIATFDRLDAPVQDKSANILIFSPQYIQEVSIDATTYPHTLDAQSLPAAVIAEAGMTTNSGLGSPFQLITKPTKRKNAATDNADDMRPTKARKACEGSADIDQDTVFTEFVDSD